jgi:hypothetical protein
MWGRSGSLLLVSSALLCFAGRSNVCGFISRWDCHPPGRPPPPPRDAGEGLPPPHPSRSRSGGRQPPGWRGRGRAAAPRGRQITDAGIISSPSTCGTTLGLETDILGPREFLHSVISRGGGLQPENSIAIGTKKPLLVRGGGGRVLLLGSGSGELGLTQGSQNPTRK